MLPLSSLLHNCLILLSLHLQKLLVLYSTLRWLSLYLRSSFLKTLRIVHVAHKALQGSDITLAKAGGTVERLKVSLGNWRSYKHFWWLYGQAQDVCKAQGVNMPLLTSTGCAADTQLSAPAQQCTTQQSVKAPLSLWEYLIPSTLGQRENRDLASDTNKLQECEGSAHSPPYKQL